MAVDCTEESPVAGKGIEQSPSLDLKNLQIVPFMGKKNFHPMDRIIGGASFEVHRKKEQTVPIEIIEDYLRSFELERASTKCGFDQAADSHDLMITSRAGFEYPGEKDWVLGLVTNDGMHLQQLTQKWKNDFEVVMTAINQNGCSLMHASKEMKNNPRVVLLAISKLAHAFEHASENLKDHSNFVAMAIKINPRAFKFASERLRNDGHFILEAITQSFEVLRFASKSLKSNTHFIGHCLSKNTNCLKYADFTLRDSKDFVDFFIDMDVNCLNHVSEELKSDRDFMLGRIVKNAEAIVFASAVLKTSRDFVKMAFESNWEIIMHEPQLIHYVQAIEKPEQKEEIEFEESFSFKRKAVSVDAVEMNEETMSPRYEISHSLIPRQDSSIFGRKCLKRKLSEAFM